MCAFCVSFSRRKLKSLQRKLHQANTKNYANGLCSQCATKMKHNKRQTIKALSATTQTVFHWKLTKEMRSVSLPSKHGLELEYDRDDSSWFFSIFWKEKIAFFPHTFCKRQVFIFRVPIYSGRTITIWENKNRLRAPCAVWSHAECIKS